MPKSRRRHVRLFLDRELKAGCLELEAPEAHYLSNVLRLKRADRVIVFNGCGAEFESTIMNLTKRSAVLELAGRLTPMPEPALRLTLVQSVTKGDAMDSIVQKATELGVADVFPVTTEHTVVRLDDERAARRLEHWQRIARGACEQSGRHRPAVIHAPLELGHCLSAMPQGPRRICFDPLAAAAAARAAPVPEGVCLLVGPEGGLSERDLGLATDHGFERLRLGPRTLRADTAAIVACALAQHLWGDLNWSRPAQ